MTMTDFPFMTLTSFRASGRDVDHAALEEAAGVDMEGTEAGRVYAHGYLYIERYKAFAHWHPVSADEEDNGWCLTITNDSWVGPLRTLEAILYGYARVEILPRLTGDAEEWALINEWQTFCRDELLECVSADEMLTKLQADREENPLDADLIHARMAYVRDYIERWERWEKEDKR